MEGIRPPEHIRNQLDIKYSLEGRSIIIYEVKLTYVKTTDCWKLYWMRSDLKWHSYDPDPEVDTLKEGLQAVKADQLGCFRG